jgi:hypothetical protein
MILTSLLLSAVFLGSVFVIARSRFGIGGVCWLSAVSFFAFGLWSPSPAAFLQALLTFAASLGCLFFHAKPKALLTSSVCVAALSYGFILYISVAELRELQQLREEYPLESMVQRLAYERNQQVATSQHDDSVRTPPLSADMGHLLSDFEMRGRGNFRRAVLSSLHDLKRDQFAIARGFGSVRMLRVTKEGIEIPESDPILLPDPPKIEPLYEPEDSVEDSPSFVVDKPAAKNGPSRGDLWWMHRHGLEDFLEPERIGYVVDRDHVAGFQSHQFVNSPELLLGEEHRQEWHVTQLELVSLLKYNEPGVYVSRHLPRMDELKDAPRRPLNAFEGQALKSLRHQEDLIVDDGLNRIRMLGSLRAGKDCLECHQVKRGELLGAFSYELHRVHPIRPKARRSKPHGPQT